MTRAVVCCAAFAALFATAFFARRATSTFARVQARAVEARALAGEFGLPPEAVMALLDLSEGALPAPALRDLAARVVAARQELGDLGLAVASATGHGVLVRDLLANSTPASAQARLRARPEGLVVTRFLSMTERYRVP